MNGQGQLFDVPAVLPPGAFVITVLTPPNAFGNCRFDVEWTGYRPDLGGSGPRVHCAFGDARMHIYDLRLRGHPVQVVGLEDQEGVS